MLLTEFDAYMDSEERDDLYHLLGKAKSIEASPFFARNVMRRLREEQARQQKRHWFSWCLRFVLPATAALLVFGTFLSPTLTKPQVLQALKDPAEFEAIENLDDLIAYEDNSVWLNENTTF